MMISRKLDDGKMYYLCPCCGCEWIHFRCASIVQKHHITTVLNKNTSVRLQTEEEFQNYSDKRDRLVRGTCINIDFYCEDCGNGWTETIEFYKGNITQYIEKGSIKKLSSEECAYELWRD